MRPSVGGGDQRCDDGLAGLIPRRPLLAASASVVEAHDGAGVALGSAGVSGQQSRSAPASCRGQIVYWLGRLPSRCLRLSLA